MKTRYRVATEKCGLFKTRQVVVLQVLRKFPGDGMDAPPSRQYGYEDWVDARVEDLVDILGAP